jgi:hypothetical protein
MDRANQGNRLFNKDVEEYVGVADPLLAFPSRKNWKTAGASVGVSAVVHESYFDLSPYTLDDLTLVPLTCQLQDGMPYFYTLVNPANSGVGVWVIDVVSQERLDIEATLADIGTGNPPGSLTTTENFEQILMCNTRFMSIDAQVGVSNLLTANTAGKMGSNSPTAVEKLWLYRFVACGRGVAGITPGDAIVIPATRFVIGADIIREDEIPYLMRLKRSFELSTGP